MSEEDPGYHNKLGHSIMAAEPLEAMAHFARAIQLGYAKPDCYCDQSALLLQGKKFEDTLQVCQSGLQICGEHPVILGNQGVALSRLGRPEEALVSFQRQAALVKEPERPWCNLGSVFTDLGRFAEAKRHFQQAIHFHPNNREAHAGLSLVLLLEEDYAQGFREYEMRPAAAHESHFPQPVWRGERLDNKRILIRAEQGAGDVMQFARYVPLIRERGGQPILEIPPTLARLFAWDAGKFETVIIGEQRTDFDLQCPLLSLPYLCQTDKDSIPPPQTIILPDEMKRRWAGVVGDTDQPKVALVWAGNPQHSNDACRSMALSALAPLLGHGNLRWFSLQVGPAASQIAAHGWTGRILDVSPLLKDYAETAGALSKMDLLITVDTSVAHLAGTLRVPVWMLVPFVPDWRWLLKREDSPWYPSMRLFRQPARKDWTSVVEVVGSELRKRFPEKHSTATGKTSTEAPAAKLDLAPPYQLVRSRHGWMLCNLNDMYMGKAIATYGECCEIESQFLLNLARRGGLVVEVGANMGIHTIPLARSLAEQGRKMLAFEPQRVIFQQLCANLALNSLTNVTALPYACGAEAGVVTFTEPDYRRTGNFGGISMELGGSKTKPSTARVPCVRLDEMVCGEQVGLLKVDVEGFERRVLEGAVATLQQSRPFLYVENDRVEHSRDLIEWIWTAGYNLWWHIPWLFNPSNYFGVAENLYAGIGSFNMLAVPKEIAGTIHGLEPIVDSSLHPLSRKALK